MTKPTTERHKFMPLTTNGGCYFADCSCAWLGGVFPSRSLAREAWQAHVDGKPRVQPIKTVVTFGERARGMSS